MEGLEMCCRVLQRRGCTHHPTGYERPVWVMPCVQCPRAERGWVVGVLMWDWRCLGWELKAV